MAALVPLEGGAFWVDEADARTLRLLEAYGQLVANTDRHYGNVSLLIQGDDWVLSPTHDMLPMLYAPVGGELVAREFSSQFLQPRAATLPEWAEAKTLAVAFWQTAADDARVSAGFRAIAAENLHKIRQQTLWNLRHQQVPTGLRRLLNAGQHPATVALA